MFLLAPLLCLGCYSTTRIQPRDIPKLNGASTIDIGSVATPTNNRTYAITVSNVRKLDGTLHQVKGEFDLLLCTRGAVCTWYTHPVEAQLKDSTLHVLSGNQPPAAIELDSVVGAAVEEFNPTGTIVAVSLSGVTLAGLLVLLL